MVCDGLLTLTLTLTRPGAGHRWHGQGPGLLTRWSGTESPARRETFRPWQTSNRYRCRRGASMRRARPWPADPVKRYQVGSVAGDLPALADLEPVPLPALLTLATPGAGHRDHGQAPALLTRWNGSTVASWQAWPLPARCINATGKALAC